VLSSTNQTATLAVGRKRHAEASERSLWLSQRRGLFPFTRITKAEE
jgi:hypothetical protein